MNERQAFALKHPLNSADGGPAAVDPYRTIIRQPDGNLLLSILAIDR
jgi:hypothetical protein